MAKILFAWELGGGAGHVAPFYSIACSLVAAGHELTLVVRDPARALRLFDKLNVKVIQAPTATVNLPKLFANVTTYPQILHNVGFSDVEVCDRIVRYWQEIVARIDPALVIVDHAPGALLALRGQERKTALIGNGFFIPPPDSPLPSLIDATTANNRCDPATDERNLTDAINHVLTGRNIPPLNFIGELFEDRNNLFLSTFAELDHYQNRLNASYRGGLAYPDLRCEALPWPPGSGARIFAYLKSSQGLGHLFDELGKIGNPTLIVCDGMDVSPLQRLAKPNMRFVDRPLPIGQVARECDFAILNATHGVTCSLLLAGKPMLLLPHNLEQLITSQRVTRIGAATQVDRNDGLSIVSALHTLRCEPHFAVAAQAFADRYRWFDSESAALAIATILDRMIA